MKLFVSTVACLMLSTMPSAASIIYVVDDSSSADSYSSKIITLDTTTWQETTLNEDTGRRMTDIALTTNGSDIYTISAGSNKYLCRYDAAGNEAGEWNLGVKNYVNNLVMESSSSLLMMAADIAHLWRVNLDSSGNFASTTDLGDIGVYSTGDMAISSTGQIYFVGSGYSTSTISELYELTFNNGAPTATLIGTINENGTSLDAVFGLAFDEQGILYCGNTVNGQEKLYTLDTGKASASEIYDFKTPNAINGLSAIPEPATIGLLIGGLMFVRRVGKRG